MVWVLAFSTIATSLLTWACQVIPSLILWLSLSILASEEAGPGFSSLVKSLSKETLELVNENVLASMIHAIKAGGQLACYAALAMTTIGTRLVKIIGSI